MLLQKVWNVLQRSFMPLPVPCSLLFTGLLLLACCTLHASARKEGGRKEYVYEMNVLLKSSITSIIQIFNRNAAPFNSGSAFSSATVAIAATSYMLPKIEDRVGARSLCLEIKDNDQTLVWLLYFLHAIFQSDSFGINIKKNVRIFQTLDATRLCSRRTLSY